MTAINHSVNRIDWIDAVRAIAIVLVVLTHAHELSNVNNIGTQSLLYSIDRIGVPLFFMISGGLLLNKLYLVDKLKFYRKRIPQFIFLLLFYSVLTNSIHFYFSGLPISEAITKSFKEYNGIFSQDTGVAVHLWFLYAIIFLYLLAPYLSLLLVNLSNKEILVILLVLLFLHQFAYTLNFFNFPIMLIERMKYDLHLSYVFYFIFGYYFIDRNIINTKKWINVFLAMCLLIIPIIFLYYYESKKQQFIGEFHWYATSIFIACSSVGAIILLKAYFEKRTYPLLTKIARYSFGIYLIHYAVMLFAIGIFKNSFNHFHWYEKTLFLLIISILVSYFLTYWLSKMKRFRYLVM
ncbi:acyltransferase [Suttonella ornithocola]|uniref:Inner membrane protein YiaH n=1 Tax=Suttonella ornithocola TaxID=279832 RepID=A0A380MYJ5_9GAMM|nr:acyltransferase [Suttonella ornithocola]SUO97619.1 Inner membrane protein YiaH [Suttonella ornithocola]